MRKRFQAGRPTINHVRPTPHAKSGFGHGAGFGGIPSDPRAGSVLDGYIRSVKKYKVHDGMSRIFSWYRIDGHPYREDG
jgi:hypothetical protein